MERSEQNSTESGIRFLDPKTVQFARTEGGYLSFSCGDLSAERVRLCRTLPYGDPDRFISVCTPEDGQELGMLRDLNELPREQQTPVREELERLYYIPEILRIFSAKMRMGFMEFDVETAAGRKCFRMRDPSRNIRFLTPGDHRVQLTDTEGNRYLIPDPNRLDRKSRRAIELYLV